MRKMKENNKSKIGKGDPLINELEDIIGNNNYPIELIGFILREKNKSYNMGIKKAQKIISNKIFNNYFKANEKIDRIGLHIYLSILQEGNIKLRNIGS